MTDRPCVVTIGFFDGVHRGHQYILSQVMEEAKRCDMTSAVVTFYNHPLTIVRPGFEPLLLSSPEEKLQLIENTGIEKVEMLHFTYEMSQLSSEMFMTQVLRDKLNTRKLIIGYDNHIGHDRLSFHDLVAVGKRYGIEVIQANEHIQDESIRFSSSVIRKALIDGDIEKANFVLGRNYPISGKVVDGFHNGRIIGYPTANVLSDCKGKLIPHTGVYAVKVHLGDTLLSGMMNIGHRPTFHNGEEQTLEVNIFDFNADIYSERIIIEFVHYIREEREFNDVEELKAQIEKDEARCRKLLS